jgi:hypothetical protein
MVLQTLGPETYVESFHILNCQSTGYENYTCFYNLRGTVTIFYAVNVLDAQLCPGGHRVYNALVGTPSYCFKCPIQPRHPSTFVRRPVLGTFPVSFEGPVASQADIAKTAKLATIHRVTVCRVVSTQRLHRPPDRQVQEIRSLHCILYNLDYIDPGVFMMIDSTVVVYNIVYCIVIECC